MYEHLLGMWLITDNPRYLEPMHAIMPLIVDQWRSGADGPQGSPEWTAKAVRRRIIDTVSRWRLISQDERYDEFLKQVGSTHVRHRLGSVEESAVIGALQTSLDYNARNYEMLTSEVLFTDRVFLKGVDDIAAMYGGTVGISQSPTHAVRWENGGLDLAAWVTEATRERFSARVYSFASRAKQIGLQHWRLKPGRYTVTVSKNDSAQEPIWQRQLMLEHRGDTISIELPPKQEFVVEFSLSKPFPWNPSRLPDLAAAAKPVSVGSDRVDWQIFNLGNTAARNVTVRLSVGGKTHAIQTIRELPAIIDWDPRCFRSQGFRTRERLRLSSIRRT